MIATPHTTKTDIPTEMPKTGTPTEAPRTGFATEAPKTGIPTGRGNDTVVRPISVLVADDHPAVRAGVRLLIEDQPDMVAVGEAASPEGALAKLDLRPDVLVLDYHFGGQQNGLSLTRLLADSKRRPSVLIYSAFADEALAVAAIVAGADGLLSKRSLGDELCDVIRLLAAGRRNFPAISRPVADAMSSRLSEPDQMIFGMLLHGLAPEQISEALKLDAAELESHRSAMLRALAPKIRDTAPSSTAPLDYEPLRARLIAGHSGARAERRSGSAFRRR